MPAQLLAAQPALFYAVLFAFGACLGSFLTVLVARLPTMMARAAEAEARDWLGQEPAAAAPRFDLMWPASHCPACDHRLRWYENIPLLSFAVQRGRCRACGVRVPWRYPVLEAASGLLAVAAVAALGPTAQGVAAIALLLSLLAVTAIDLEHQLIPDALSLPLLWLGLVLNAFGLFASASDAILGAAVGYGALWLVATGYRLFAGKEAMGQGDLKLAAAAGAWLGIGAMPGFFLIAFVSGAAIGLGLMATRRAGLASAVPFGPFLAAGAAVGILLPGVTGALGALFAP